MNKSNVMSGYTVVGFIVRNSHQVTSSRIGHKKWEIGSAYILSERIGGGGREYESGLLSSGCSEKGGDGGRTG